MFDLPPHLQTLNSISTSRPSSASTQQEEEAFWGFMHTEDLFANFGAAPSPIDEKKQENLAAPTPVQISVPAPTPVSNVVADTPASSSASAATAATTLESFLAAFANDQSNTSNNFNLLNLPVPFSSASSSAPTPAGGINTSELISNYYDSPLDADGEDRISGAKRLKQLGAGQAEIEEDKRRRNTEASARFRAKKKEREMAVEKRAKDLENQVAQLAAEKASLENENRLLKAIVLNGSGGQADALQQALASFGGKRKRD